MGPLDDRSFCEIRGDRLGHYLSATTPENIIFFYKEEDDDIRGLRTDLPPLTPPPPSLLATLAGQLRTDRGRVAVRQ